MCISSTMMMALSTGVSVAGQLAQGQAAKAAANAEARAAENLAAQTRDAAQQEAVRIRKAGDRARGAARAQLAAAGIDVNSGTAVTIDGDIGTNAELDAFQQRRRFLEDQIEADITGLGIFGDVAPAGFVG